MKTIREVLEQFSDSYEILDSYQRRDLEAAILAERPWLDYPCRGGEIVTTDGKMSVKEIADLHKRNAYTDHPYAQATKERIDTLLSMIREMHNHILVRADHTDNCAVWSQMVACNCDRSRLLEETEGI